MTIPNNALAYLRVSTDLQDLGPEAQRDQIRRFAERTGIEVLEWFEDRVSGALEVKSRPEFERLLDRLTAGDCRFVIVAKRDRIARDVVIAAAVTKAIEGVGAKLLSADGVTAEDTPEGKLTRLILDAFAEYERLQIGARTRAALRVKKARFEPTGGVIPFGWMLDPASRRRSPKGYTAKNIVPCPVEQEVAQLVVQWHGEGLYLRQIASALGARGYRPRKGTKWQTSTIHRIIRRARVDT